MGLLNPETCPHCHEAWDDEAYHCQCADCQCGYDCHFDCDNDDSACQGCQDGYQDLQDARYAIDQAQGRH